MLADEAEPAVANLHRGQEVPEVHPTVRVHLEAVSLREVSQDAGHRAAEELDLLVVEEELAFGAAVRAELFPEIPERTTFLEHASPPLGGWYSPSPYEPSSCGSTERDRPPGRCGGPGSPAAPRMFERPVSKGSCGARTPASRPRFARRPGRSRDPIHARARRRREGDRRRLVAPGRDRSVAGRNVRPRGRSRFGRRPVRAPGAHVRSLETPRGPPTPFPCSPVRCRTSASSDTDRDASPRTSRCMGALSPPSAVLSRPPSSNEARTARASPVALRIRPRADCRSDGRSGWAAGSRRHASTDTRRPRRVARRPPRGPGPGGPDTGGVRGSSRGRCPATATRAVHRTAPAPKRPMPGARPVGCGSPRPPRRPRRTARMRQWTPRPRPFLRCRPHNLYVRRSGTAAGAHGHGHLPILGARLPGRPRRGGREASPRGPPGVEGGHPLPRSEQTRLGQLQAPIRACDPGERTDGVRGRPAVPDARRADRDGRSRTHLPAHRAASDPRDADGGRGRETGRAGETPGRPGDKAVPLTRVARSGPRLPMENPVLAKTI